MQGRRLQYSLKSDMLSGTDTADAKFTWMCVLCQFAADHSLLEKIKDRQMAYSPICLFCRSYNFNDLCQCHSMRLLALSFRFFGLALLIFVFLSVLRLSVCVFRLFIVLSVCCFAVFHDSSLLAIIVCRRENYMAGKKRFFDVYI